MRKCPNCGQPTSRTKDWACRWCGYPLISTAYRQLDQTYQELKEEGLGGAGVTVSAAAEVPAAPVEVTAPPEPAPEAEPEAGPEAEPALEVEVEPVAEAEPEPEPVEKPKARRAPKAEVKPKEEAKPKARRKTKAEAEPEAEAKAEGAAEPVAEAEVEAEAGKRTEAEAEAQLEAALGGESGAEAVVEAEPEPVPVPKPEIVADAMAVTVEEMHAAFRENSAAAEKKFAGKTLHVTGVVSIVSAGAEAETPSLILTGHDITALENMVCMFDEKYRSELSRLKEEQTVKVQGKYESRTINILLLGDCVLVS